MKRLVAFWGGVAVVLSGATELRFAALPIGPGEILLASWILLVTFLLLSRRVVLSPEFRVLLAYWLAAAGLLGLGAMMAVIEGKVDTSTGGGPIHDAVAFSLVAVLSCFLALRWRDQDHAYHLSIARSVFFIFTVCVTALLAVAMVLPDLGVVHPWYGYRFRGWADNPNQMALAAIAMPYLGWYLRGKTHGGRRAAYDVAIVCNIAIGLATASDGLRVAWLGSLGIVGMIAWFRPMHHRGSLVPYVFYVMVPVLLVFGTVALGPQIIAGIEQAATSVYEEGNQGQKRITAWVNGLHAMAESPLVGWGPGAFSGMSGPFQGFEAHNNLIDWGMSTGGIGVALHVALLGWCVWRALKAGTLTLVGAVASLTIASMFGYMLRQPVYWLVLVLVVSLSGREKARGVAHNARTDQLAPRSPIRLQSG